MSEKISHETPKAQKEPTGLYDFAIYVARSFGKTLPVVIVVVLIAYGAWYAIREMATLQSELIKIERQKQVAEIAKAQAEADAKTAADRARYEALKEYSKQLTDLSVVSADISKRIQLLVSGQVDNMKKSEELTKIQNKRARDYQTEIASAAENKLHELKTQIADATKKAQRQVRAAALAGYQSLKRSIVLELNDKNSIDSQVLDLLTASLSDSVVEKQAIRDIRDNKNTWKFRALLSLQFFKITSIADYLDRAQRRINENKLEADRSISSLFSGYDAFSSQQQSLLLPIVIGFILDDGFDKEFREELLSSPIVTFAENLAQKLDPDTVPKLIKYVGSLLLERASAANSYCYDVKEAIGVLGKLSIDERSAYSHKALQNSAGLESEKNCIKTELEKAADGIQPLAR